VTESERRKRPGVRLTPGGKWQARYYDPDGLRRGKTFQRKSDALAFLAVTKTDMRRGDWIDPALGATTFDEWAISWMKGVANLRPKTRIDYESVLRCHILPAFRSRRLVGLQPIDVQQWVAETIVAGTSPAMVRKSYRMLAAILKAAVDSDYLGRSPCRGVKLPRVPHKEMRFLTAEEVERLAMAIRDPYGVLIYTFAYGGLRWGEAGALRRGRCDLLHSRLDVVESLAWSCPPRPDTEPTLRLGL